MSMFSQSDMDFLSGPHVARCWFGEFHLSDGVSYLHNGIGRVTVEGQEYRGVSDPIGGQLVAISSIDDPRFGQAAKVDVIIGNVNVEAYKAMKANARDIEGRMAILRFGAFDPETGEVRLFKNMLPGKISSPKLKRQGIGLRYIALTIEGFWQAQNYPFGGRWTDADQRRRYPSDKGLMYVGVRVMESWQ